MKPALLGISAFVAGAAISATVLASGKTETGGTLNKAEVETIVHEYIMANPKVILDSVEKWQRGETDRQAEAAKDQIKDRHDEIFNDKIDGYGGNTKGDITIVEFFDYNCPACKMMFKGLDELIKKDDNVKVIFKEMPIFGPQSEQNSLVGLAVASLAPEKYLAFHEGVMGKEGRITSDEAIKIAVGLGLKEDAIREEMKNEALVKQIQKNHALADSLNVRGTPAIVIGNKLIPSAMGYEALKTLVEEERKKR